MITKDMVTQVATYLGVNIFQFFVQAAEWQDEGTNDEQIKLDYNAFVAEQLVPDYVMEYCELTIQTMEG